MNDRRPAPALHGAGAAVDRGAGGRGSRPRTARRRSGAHPSSGANRNEIELMQYRWSVGVG